MVSICFDTQLTTVSQTCGQKTELTWRGDNRVALLELLGANKAVS